MKATEMELPGIGEPESLRARTRELSDPAPGQALVRVEATGVSFAEQQMRRGKYYDQPAFPFVPGYDLVGVVERLGGGSTAPEIGVGARVAALTKVGAWADRVLLDARDLVSLLAHGAISAQIAARFPLSQATVAMRFAEAGGHTGKVILIPDAEPAAQATGGV